MERSQLILRKAYVLIFLIGFTHAKCDTLIDNILVKDVEENNISLEQCLIDDTAKYEEYINEQKLAEKIYVDDVVGQKFINIT